MRGAIDTIVRAFAADSLTSAVAAGSPSTSGIQLGAGAAASWSKDDVINVTGTGASVANHRLTTRIVGVDTVLDQVTVDPPLSVTPAAGDFLRGGVLEWLHGSTGIHVRAPKYSDPIAADLLSPTDEHGCVCFVGPLPASPVIFTATDEGFEARFISRDYSWSEGGGQRGWRLVHAWRTALAIAGRHVSQIRVRTLEPRDREDELHEHMVGFAVGHAAEAA